MEHLPQERQHLLDRLLDAVKQCQVRFGGRTELATDSDSRVSCLCAQFEAVLVHGLKRGMANPLNALKQMTGITVPNLPLMRPEGEQVLFWPVVRESLTKHELQRYMGLKHISSDGGRARAWLRSTLNEHSLERYLHALLGMPDMLKQFYEPWSFLLDEERASMIPTMARGLGSILFAINIDKEELNGFKQPPTLSSLIQTPEVVHSYSLDDRDPEPVYVAAAANTGGPSEKKEKKKRKKKSLISIVSFNDDDSGSTVISCGSPPSRLHHHHHHHHRPRKDSTGAAQAGSARDSNHNSLPKGTVGFDAAAPGQPGADSGSAVGRTAAVAPKHREPPGNGTSQSDLGRPGRLQDRVSSHSVTADRVEAMPRAYEANHSGVEPSGQGVHGHAGHHRGEAPQTAPVQIPMAFGRILPAGGAASLSGSEGSGDVGVDGREADAQLATSFPAKTPPPTPISATLAGRYGPMHGALDADSVADRLRLQEEVSSRGAEPDTGAVIRPKGVVTQQLGVATQPMGMATQPTGVAIQPMGVATQPLGVAIQPTGASTPPMGVAIHPVGVAIQPMGMATQPMGVANQPTGVVGNSSQEGRVTMALPINQSFQNDVGEETPPICSATPPMGVSGDNGREGGAPRSSTSRQSFHIISGSGEEESEVAMYPVNDDSTSQQDTQSTDSSMLGYGAETENAALGLLLAQKSFKDSLQNTAYPGTPEDNSSSYQAMTNDELKQAVIAMMNRNDDMQEENRSLRSLLDSEMEHTAKVRGQLQELKRSTQEKEEKLQTQLAALTRENDVLKHQLKKYVGAVQMLRREGAQAVEGLPGIRASDFQPPIPEPKQGLHRSGEEVEDYERKLIQVAEMHGELMEFNDFLSRQLKARDLTVKRLQDELIDLRGPLPRDQTAAMLNYGAESDSNPSNHRALVNIWIPSAFLRGKGSDAFHVYQIYVRIRDEEWNVYRRYTEFRDLHLQIRKDNAIVNTFDFPPKKAVGNKDSKFVEDRRKKLQHYIRRVVNYHVENTNRLTNNPCKEVLLAVFPFFMDEPTRLQSRSSNANRSNKLVAGRKPVSGTPTYDGL